MFLKPAERPGVFFAQEEPRHNTAGIATFLWLSDVFLRSITIATLAAVKNFIRHTLPALIL
jgi:hypothetical protein